MPKAPENLLEWPTRGLRFYELRNIYKVSYAYLPDKTHLLFKLSKECDVILVDMNIADHGPIGYFLSKVMLKPLVYVFHCPLFLPSAFLHNTYTKLVTLRFLKHAKALWVINSDEGRYLAALGLGNVYVIPYGVDTKKFRPLDATKEDIFTVLFAARMVRQKGIDILLDAAQRILSKGMKTNVRFWFTGWGCSNEIYHKMRNLIKDYGKNRINYLGFTPHERMPAILSQANLLVMPSRWESFGMPALEAQACGVPVVATNIQGLRDIVKHLKTGTLIKPDSLPELVDAILFFYNLWERAPDTYNMFCERARANALNYDWGILASKVDAMLRNACEGN